MLTRSTRIIGVSGLLAALACAWPVQAQSTAATDVVALGRVRSTADQPFRAAWVTTSVQTLSDGTQVTYVEREVRIRDAEGRVRIERYAPRNDSSPEATGTPSGEPVSVEIADPVAGQTIRLSPLKKTAAITAFPVPSEVRPAPPVHFAAPPSAATVLPRPQFEQLGTQSIDGVEAVGTRITQVIPVGAQGNDRDLTIVHESWFSPELKIDLLTKHSDPRSGDATTEVKDLSLEQPDPALFQVPEGYKVAAQTPQ